MEFCSYDNIFQDTDLPVSRPRASNRPRGDARSVNNARGSPTHQRVGVLFPQGLASRGMELCSSRAGFAYPADAAWGGTFWRLLGSLFSLLGSSRAFLGLFLGLSWFCLRFCCNCWSIFEGLGKVWGGFREGLGRVSSTFFRTFIVHFDFAKTCSRPIKTVSGSTYRQTWRPAKVRKMPQRRPRNRCKQGLVT